MKFFRLISLIISLTIIPNISAATINIPADYPTMQAGIDVAVDGDIIEISPETY